MSIYHGACKGYHQTIAEARACAGVGYGGKQLAYRQGHTLDRRPPSQRRHESEPATPPQIRFIRGLEHTRVVPEAGRSPEEAQLWERLFDLNGWRGEEYDSEHDKFVSKREASAIIDWLKRLPFKPDAEDAQKREPQEMAKTMVPAGKYALVGQDGIVRFYQVDRPEDGRWKGYVFVKGLLGSPGSWNRIRLNRDDARRVLDEIGKDVRGAAVLFGRKTEHCGRCDSPLSHLRSRAAGYGEHCAGVLGWPYPTEAEARRILQELTTATPKPA